VDRDRCASIVALGSIDVMARSRRRLIAGGIYHVTTRGNRKQPIFLSDDDRIFFLELLKKVVRDRQWSVHCYCLLLNHYHLLVETPKPDLSRGMQTINGEYAQWFNRGHCFVGHVFQGRFYAGLVESDWHLLELTRYIAMNPVRAGLCVAPSDWPWSSFGKLMSGSASPFGAKVLAFFGANQARARQAFGQFVEESAVR
jgi:putative transposase